MKNLKCIKEFMVGNLSMSQLRQIKGGDRETGAGTITVSTSISSTGCLSVSSDLYESGEGGRLIAYSGGTDVACDKIATII